MCKASILLLPHLLACGFHMSSRSDIPETDPGSFWQNSLFGLPIATPEAREVNVRRVIDRAGGAIHVNGG